MKKLLAVFLFSLASFANADDATIVSNVTIDDTNIVTYFNEVTEQVCTFNPNSPRAGIVCVPLHTLSNKAVNNIRHIAEQGK